MVASHFRRIVLLAVLVSKLTLLRSCPIRVHSATLKEMDSSHTQHSKKKLFMHTQFRPTPNPHTSARLPPTTTSVAHIMGRERVTATAHDVEFGLSHAITHVFAKKDTRLWQPSLSTCWHMWSLSHWHLCETLPFTFTCWHPWR